MALPSASSMDLADMVTVCGLKSWQERGELEGICEKDETRARRGPSGPVFAVAMNDGNRVGPSQ